MQDFSALIGRSFMWLWPNVCYLVVRMKVVLLLAVARESLSILIQMIIKFFYIEPINSLINIKACPGMASQIYLQNIISQQLACIHCQIFVQSRRPTIHINITRLIYRLLRCHSSPSFSLFILMRARVKLLLVSDGCSCWRQWTFVLDVFGQSCNKLQEVQQNQHPAAGRLKKLLMLAFYLSTLCLFSVKNFILHYPSLDQYNWSCAWCPIPEHQHISLKQKQIFNIQPQHPRLLQHFFNFISQD